MTHPGTPRDVDMPGWLDGVAHHAPADQRTVLAHEAARDLIGQLGITLFHLLPPGRDKSMVFTLLEDVLMRANRAIAISGGPAAAVVDGDLQRMMGTQPRVPNMSSWTEEDASDFLDRVNAEVNRVHPGLGWVLAEGKGTTEAPPIPAQRAPLTETPPEKPFTQTRYTQGEAPDAHTTLLVKFQEHWADPRVSVDLSKHDEGENISAGVGMDLDDPDALEEIGAAFVAAAKRLRAARAGR